MKNPIFWAVICLSITYGLATPISRPDENPVQVKPSEEESKQQVEPQGKGVLAKGKLEEDTTGVFQKESEHAKSAAVPDEESKIVAETKPNEKAENNDKKTKATGRQSANEEDDDDDDDDLDLGVDDDDDDDDDAAADDDDDDDYFGGFFDDILGEDDDDDDDEPASSPAASQPAEAAQEASQETVVEPVVEEAAEEASSAVESETSSEGTVVEQEQTGDETIGEKDPNNDLNESSQNTVEEPVVVNPVPADDEANEDEDDDDDDDDGLDLTADDDDDDDDDDDVADDDDDDDDDDFGDVLEVKRSRALQNGQTQLPSAYITKYNRFVDNIVGRINRILMKSYDPVRVKLQSKSSPTKTKSTTKRRKTNKKTNVHTDKSAPRVPPSELHKMGNYEISRSIESESREPPYVLLSKAGTISSYSSTTEKMEPKAKSSRKSTRKNSNKRKNNKGKNNSSSNKKQQKTRATLFGLSSIRRDGDVAVNMLADHTTVKANFLLGPLTLRVEKEFGKGERRELKSATATTADMHGKLTLKIVNGGAATLHSIKVLQPKQVRIESKEDNDKTHKYIWKKSSHIAEVVSQKLATATKSMLKPPPHP